LSAVINPHIPKTTLLSWQSSCMDLSVVSACTLCACLL